MLCAQVHRSRGWLLPASNAQSVTKLHARLARQAAAWAAREQTMAALRDGYEGLRAERALRQARGWPAAGDEASVEAVVALLGELRQRGAQLGGAVRAAQPTKLASQPPEPASQADPSRLVRRVLP